ncbi:MAG: WYL domain-containing protein [Termitinemataceae bacterium]|nr:MAG: WYL domain-containing protein [Termitinemataceae bacterium]
MDTRKSLPRSAFARIYYIDKEIASGKYPNVPQLANGWETSESTINRDIDYMRLMLDAPIEYDFKQRGYYYSKKTFRLPAGFTSPDELLTLGMTKSLLALYKDTPLYETAHTLLDVITTPLELHDKRNSGKNSSWYDDRIIVPKPASSPVPHDLWNVIIAGLRENRVITFDYLGLNDKQFYTRCVHPWQLLFDNGVWILHSFCEDKKSPRRFVLSRMQAAFLTDRKFSLPKDYDYRINKDKKGNILPQSYFGVFAGDVLLKYRIALYGSAVFLARERIWADDQKLAPKWVARPTHSPCSAPPDQLIMSFSSTQYGKVLEWVLSHGCNACPLSPPQLVNDWKQHLKAMQKLSKGHL